MSARMFSVADRERIHECVLRWAAADERIVSGAVVGSLAVDGAGDRWSDLDLTFAVADDEPMHDVLEDWTGRLAAEFHTVTLFDLPAGASIYRVFLLPGCLQFDLSFNPRFSVRRVRSEVQTAFYADPMKDKFGPPGASRGCRTIFPVF